MTIIRITFMSISINYKTLFCSCDECRFISKLITFVSFTFRDTNSLWLSKAIEFVFRVSLLHKESLALFYQNLGIETYFLLFLGSLYRLFNITLSFLSVAALRLNCLAWLYPEYLISSFLPTRI